MVKPLEIVSVTQLHLSKQLTLHKQNQFHLKQKQIAI